MENKTIFYIDSTDVRSEIVGEMLKKLGKNVASITENCDNTQKIANYVYIFAPSKNFTEIEAQRLNKNSTVFCGKISDAVKDIFKENSITHKNYLSSEKFAVDNAILTAEGILGTMLLSGNSSITDCKVLILGLGRIAKATAILFDKLGVSYALSTFDFNEYSQSRLYGKNCFYMREYASHINEFDVIINTIPKQFVSENEANNIQRGARFIEVASVSCIDNRYIEGFSYIVAAGLPKKYAPKSAARLMLDFITGEKYGETEY